jgi:hypothetical protein
MRRGDAVGPSNTDRQSIEMTHGLKGVSAEQRQELSTMLERLGALWAELTRVAADQDETRVKEIQSEIAACRKRVEEIKRAGTLGSA